MDTAWGCFPGLEESGARFLWTASSSGLLSSSVSYILHLSPSQGLRVGFLTAKIQAGLGDEEAQVTAKTINLGGRTL